MLLLARLGDWSLEDYWNAGPPVQVAVRAAVARAFATTPERLVTAIDNCGVETYAFPLAAVAAGLRVPRRPGCACRRATRAGPGARRCARSATRWSPTRRWWAGRASGSTPRS